MNPNSFAPLVARLEEEKLELLKRIAYLEASNGVQAEVLAECREVIAELQGMVHRAHDPLIGDGEIRMRAHGRRVA